MTLVDPLAALPDPADDRTLLRTFPGAPSHGQIAWESVGPDRWRFTTSLPRRYGDLGWTREGLMANGGWYPQPVRPDDPLPVFEWTVTLNLPADASGAVGNVAGTDQLLWRGVTERVSIGVLRRGRITRLEGGQWTVDLITPRKPRRVLVAELQAGLALASEDLPLRGVAIEGPLRRRLTRPGAGLAYLSDRSYRLTPPLQRFHRVAVIRGLAAAWVPQSDGYARSIAGAAIGQQYADALKGADADALLEKLRWIPQIHWLLASEQMPFYADVLERTQPSDDLADDLSDLLSPFTTGTVVVAQLDDTFGPGTGQAVGLSLAGGSSLTEAASEAGLPSGWLSRWHTAYPVQDYRLTVDKQSATVTLHRDAPPDAPIETAIVRIDGEDHPVTQGPGTHTWQLDQPPDSVILDPDRHLGQRSRAGDAWPARYHITLSAGVSTVNLTQMQVYGAGAMSLRRAYDTHNLWRGVLYNSFSDLVGTRISYQRSEGRKLDGYARPHRFIVSTNTTLLNPGFAETDGLVPSWGMGLRYAWDNRAHGDFPLRGSRWSYGVSGGLVPGLGERWLHTGPGAVGVIPIHPRHAVALRAEATTASASVAHRKLSLSGQGAMRSLPSLPACPAVDDAGSPVPCQVLADQRAFAAFEYRVVPLRNVSVPGPLFWGSELQLTGGLEGVIASVDGELEQALGVTTGLTGLADLLGAEPYLMGVTVGWPLRWTDGLRHVEAGGWPEIYLRWSQAF